MAIIDTKYYELSQHQPHSPKTERAIAFDHTELKVALDCGCGAGADIAFLATQGYAVHAFDSSSEAVSICQNRFRAKQGIEIKRDTFLDYSYPSSSLVIAHSSLYFLERGDLDSVWNKISNCIELGGIFCGDFLGLKDDWATGFRLPTCPLPESEVKALFSDFKILSFREIDQSGSTRAGSIKHWNTYTVFAEKINHNL